tara:strand:+ start:3779 stop:4843 length:1065 start_codon:yes stop_codon:yes gene_type:complete
MNKKNTSGTNDEDVYEPWTPQEEVLLAEWADKATCYKWLHSRSEKLYRRMNYIFTIPVIILSTLTGTANFAMDSFVPEEHKQMAMAGVGSVNIFAGILSTLQNFLRYAELMESHRLSEVQWSKFGRNIAVELAMAPKKRKPVKEFLKISRLEYDRLIEQSPTIDDSIIKQFKSNFANASLKKPDICNGLDECEIYEPTKEEKAAELMSNIGMKMKEKENKTKKNTKWGKVSGHINDINHLHKTQETISHKKQDASKEIEQLTSIGKVSNLKKSLGETKAENHVEQINEISDFLNGINEFNDDEQEDILPNNNDDKPEDDKQVVDKSEDDDKPENDKQEDILPNVESDDDIEKGK